MQTSDSVSGKNVLEVLSERGFIEKTTHEKELYEVLGSSKVTCYIGFDPTASSLHVGHLLTIMTLIYMQKFGHIPIALVGGGTGLVGDPSGKTEMRKMLTYEKLKENEAGIKKQLSRFLDFSDGKAFLLNNADWLLSLKYIDMLRDIGKHFSVNKMIKAESYRSRLESEEGLNFIEFNYMILQAFDFLELSRTHDCCLQMGGSDQWGNILAGIELIRRVEKKASFGITFPLVTTSSGTKMGKTAKGAVWLDPERTSPYEFFQFWVNTSDADVEKFLCLFSFLPLQEIREVQNLKDGELNAAKSILAFEATKLVHGIEQASKAHKSSMRMFGEREIPSSILPSSDIHGIQYKREKSSIPSSSIPLKRILDGIPAFKLFFECDLVKSGSAARKMINQGGAYIHGKRISSSDYMVTDADIVENTIILRAGKKRYHKIVVTGE